MAPSSGWASTTKNCPAEPTQTTIASGNTYYGSNCVLNTTGDLDKFQFKGAVGDVWNIVAGMQGTTANICLLLQAPDGSTLVPNTCTVYPSPLSINIVQTLTVAGTYTIVMTEKSNGAEGYGLSLERLSPIPPDAAALALSTGVTGTVVPSAQNAFTFYGDTIGVYNITASMIGTSDNICFNIYKPGGTSIFNTPPCTNYPSTSSITEQITPSENAIYLLVVYTPDNDGTEGYNLQVSCFSGTCNKNPPKCMLTDSPSYNATTGTLTMNFTVGTPVAVTWNGWLISKGTMTSMWAQTQPITEPPVSVPMTQTNVTKAGYVGILSTFTTPKGGISCSSWLTINTAAP